MKLQTETLQNRVLEAWELEAEQSANGYETATGDPIESSARGLGAFG